MASIELNDQQEEAVRLGCSWWLRRHKQVFEISGPAGSGKTTLVYSLMERMNIKRENVLFVAFVGKAAMELSRKGNNAQTIHSTIYDLVEVPVLDDDGELIIKNGRVKRRPMFQKKPEVPSNIELFVIDEGGMVNKEIALDILSYGIPVLVLGDLDQLPPVIGDAFFLRNPDVILTKVMRQAEGDPIIHLSQMAKKGIYIPTGKYGDRCYVVMKDQITDDIMKSADIIICGKNKTRENINRHVRYNILGRTQDHPYIGDKIICRQNNWKLKIENDLFLINGMNGYIENIYLDTYNGKHINIDFRPEFLENECFRNIQIDYKYLFMDFEERKNQGRGYVNRFEFGYAITAHLSQGSQYDKVLLFNERMGDERFYRKWLYTAITRAKTHLILSL